MELTQSPSCYNEHSQTISDVVVGWVIIFGNFVTLLPQVAIMLQRGSNEGLNIITVMLGTISTFASLANGVDTYWERFNCCTEIEWWQCMEILLAWIQLGSWWILWHMVYVTSLIVWPVLEDEEAIKKQNKEKFLHWMVFLVYTILMSGCVAVVLFWNFYYPATSVSYKAMDNALGIISSVCMMAYLAPQVYTTWSLKGSLSMITIIFSILGSGITTYFLLRYDATPWIYIPGLIATAFFIIIFIMCAYYAYLKRRTVKQFFFPETEVGIQVADYAEEERALWEK